MTQLIPTTNIEATADAPLPPAAVPAQRSASDTCAPDLLDATAAAQHALSGTVRNDRDAVVWLSEHIAALDRVIYAVAPTGSAPSPTTSSTSWTPAPCAPSRSAAPRPPPERRRR